MSAHPFAETYVGGKSRKNVGRGILRAVCEFGGVYDLRRTSFVWDDWDEPGNEVFCHGYAEGLVALGVQGVRGGRQEPLLLLSVKRATEFQPRTFRGE